MGASPSKFVISNTFLTLKQVSLGRLVLDAANPGQDFWPSDGTSSIENIDKEVERRGFNHFEQDLGRNNCIAIQASVTEYLRLHANLGSSSSSLFSTPEAYVYTLLHPTDHFVRLCRDPKTRGWMEKAMKNSSVFLVVGLVTVVDAEAKMSLEKSRDIKAHLDAGKMPVGVEGSSEKSQHASMAFEVSGERVVGVQYRKLKFSLFSSRGLDDAFLEKNPNRWKTFVGSKGGDDDVLGSDLEEDGDPEDLELEDEDIDFSDFGNVKFLYITG